MFIHSVDNEHFNYFQFGVITNKATINAHINFFYGHVLFLLGKNLGVEWIDHMADTCLTF